MSKDSEDYLDEETFGCSDSENGDSSPAADFQCEICKNKLNSPRVLACLHVFCLNCLEQLISNGDELSDGKSVINCPSCSHETKMNGKSASSLLVAFVNGNILDMEAVRAMTVVCTSCKSEDAAVARCADCANFLCPSCNQAHQVMRCFENHHVHTLEELKESTSLIPIHKPVTCSTHTTEIIKFFCLTCQVPACSECVTEHKVAEHSYERVSEADEAVRKELRELVENAKERNESSEEACSSVSSGLTELQNNHDNARSLIEETYQSYKAILEDVRDSRLAELKSLNNQRRMAVMEVMSGIESARPHIEMATAFTNALIELGDAAEVVMSYRVVRERLQALLSAPLDTHVDVSLEFESNTDEFKRVIEKNFGKFKTAEPKASNPTSPNSSDSLALAINSANKHNGISSSPMIFTESVGRSLIGSTISIPTSGIMSSGGGSPTSLKSSCDSDLSALSSPFNLNPGLDIATPPLSQEQNSSSLSDLAMMEENFRYAQLGFDETPQSNSLSFADFATGLTKNSYALSNLAELAKLSDPTNGTLNEHHNDHSQSIMENVYNNMSQTSPVLSDIGNMNGFHSMNNMNGMNGMGDYGQPMNRMGLNRMGHVNSNGMMNGIQSMGGVGGLGSQAMAAISGINNYPPVRQSSNATSTMTVRYKYGQLGSSKGQFNSPHGFCLGNDEEVIVADTNNHRIQIFEKDGSFKYQFGTPGRDEGQLWYPRKVALMKKCGKFVVCDRGNERSRMQIFTRNGHFVRKIGIRYIDIVAGLAVTSEGYIVAVDSVSPTVFILNEAGTLLRWFDCANVMREPSDIAINGESKRQAIVDNIARTFCFNSEPINYGDEFYVCDFKGHCVVVFSKDGNFKRRIGQEGVTNFPNGIDVSDAGDVLVGDSHGNRFHVTVFSRDGQHLSDVECPYVKVSRCCGLKLTREGMIVTLAKNNHHVLILSTIFVS